MNDFVDGIIRLAQGGVVVILLAIIAALGWAVKALFGSLIDLSQRAFTAIEGSTRAIEQQTRAIEANARASEANRSAIDALRERLIVLRNKD